MSPNCGSTSRVFPFASASQFARDEKQTLVLCCFNHNMYDIQDRIGCHWLNIEAGIKALHDRMKHASCATIEYCTQAFQLLCLIALTQVRMLMTPVRMSITLNLLVLAMCLPDSFFRICSASRSQHVGQLLSQPKFNCVAKFLTCIWVRIMRLNQV